ncbi:rhodanese-like domain-containing protein [Kitasatospora sp. NPDC048365]|uniref:rhodanese-like domain-containing protein n=1 Tax=Kitasatospora sp. NPDC048365 TaxID=3364050 RepID=UPI003718CCE8
MTSLLTVTQLVDVTVIDVRTPAEYAAGHIPGALNIPLDRLERALPTLREAAERRPIAVVCASGARSATACAQLASAGIEARSVDGGTSAWASAGKALTRTPGARAVWAMDRQVRFAAGALVVLAVLGDLAVPGLRWLGAAVGAGLVFSAVSNTCAMGAALSRLPFNRPRGNAEAALEETLASLRTAA